MPLAIFGPRLRQLHHLVRKFNRALCDELLCHVKTICFAFARVSCVCLSSRDCGGHKDWWPSDWHWLGYFDRLECALYIRNMCALELHCFVLFPIVSVFVIVKVGFAVTRVYGISFSIQTHSHSEVKINLNFICCISRSPVGTRKSHQKYPWLYHGSMQFWTEVPHILALESTRTAVWKSFQMIKGTASRRLMWLLQAKRGSLVKLPRTRLPSIPHRALLRVSCHLGLTVDSGEIYTCLLIRSGGIARASKTGCLVRRLDFICPPLVGGIIFLTWLFPQLR